MKPESSLRRFLLVVGSSLLAVSSSHAADGTWNSDVTNSLWGTDTNWSGITIADGSGSTANFTNDITGDRTVRLNTDRTLTSVVFGDSDPATAGSWLLDNNGTSTNNLILAGTTPGIAVNALGTAKTATISAIIQGTAGLVKSGDGTLILSGANTYTGTTTVDGGILALATPVASGAHSFKGPLVVNANGTVRWDLNDPVPDVTVTVNGGTLNLTSKGDYIGTLSLNSGAQVQGDQSSTQYIIVNGSAGAKILGTGGGNAATISSRIAIASQWGVVTGARTQEFDVASATTLTVSGPIVNSPAGSGAQVGSLLKSNSGTLTISGANTYTGTTTVSGGTLALAANNALPASPAAIGAGTLDAATFDDATIGTLDVTDATSTINLDSGANLAFADSRAVDWTGGTLNLTGTLDFSGTATSSLRFGTSSSGLTATQLGKISASGFINFALNASGHLTAISTGGPPLIWANGADGNWTTGTWSGGPPAYPDSGTPTIIDTPWTVTVDSSQAALTLGVSNGGKVSVTDTGGLTVSGPTTLAGGTLEIASGANFSLPTVNLAGGTLAVSGTRTISSSAITLGTASTFGTPAGTDSITLGSPLGGSGGLTKAGPGTLILAGANTCTGDTTVQAGGLVFNAPASGNCLAFVVKASSNNKITGTGSATLNGPFHVNLSDSSLASLASHTWTLVDVATKTYGTSFKITGAGGDWSLNSGVWTTTAGSKTWTFTQSTGLLSGTADFASWATIQGLTGTPGDGSNVDPAFTADPNQDGIENGLAWILGADALGNPAANRLKLPAISWDGTGALNLMAFDRLTASAADAPLVVQYSDNLGATPWTDFTVNTSAGTTTDGNLSVAVAPGGGSSAVYDRITVTFPATYLAAHPKTFARLMATSTVTTPPPPIDSAMLAQWSAPYRNWHYQPNHVISSTPNIPGYASFQISDVPTVFQLPGDTTKWYMTFIAFNGGGYQSFIAESTDLVNWTNRRLAMPFGPAGAFDYGGVVLGAYLYESYDIKARRTLKLKDGKFWSLYGAYSSRSGYEAGVGSNGLASSTDGVNWTRFRNEPVLSIYDADRGAWENNVIYQPWLVEHQGMFYNFYNAKGGPEQTGMATSSDLLSWTRYANNPVIPVGASIYNSSFSADPKVFRDGNHWVCFFFGVGAGGAHIMAAFSWDLYNWTVDPTPLYLAGGNPSGLDSSYAHKISLVWNPANETFYMYYNAVGNQGRGIGLITSKQLTPGG
jgi:autotransporter-associated beta strand protein